MLAPTPFETHDLLHILITVGVRISIGAGKHLLGGSFLDFIELLERIHCCWYATNPCLLPHLGPCYLLADYDAIFQHLEALRGSVEVRKGFVRDIVKEAGKFKRKQLIQQLEEWGARLTSLKPAGTHVPHTHNKTTTLKR